MKNLGEQIYKHRTRCGLSQLDIAEKAGVSRQSVSKWENGASTPELDKLVKLTELFGITLDELVNGEGPLPQKKEQPRQCESENMFLRQVLSVIFLLLGVFSLFLYDPHISFWLLSPMFATSILLIKKPSRSPLICAWTWFLSLDIFFLVADSPVRHGILLFCYFLFLLILIIWTVSSFRGQIFTSSRKTRVFLAIGVPLMPACGAFFRFFILSLEFQNIKIQNALCYAAEIFIVDLFLAAFLICLIPTFYTVMELIKKHKHDRTNE